MAVWISAMEESITFLRGRRQPVMDTEVYLRADNRKSDSTPWLNSRRQVKIRKKDLGMMAMSYGYVYVAQISMGIT